MAGFYAKGLDVALEAVTGVAAAPTGTLKGAFMATSYTQDPEAHAYWSDVVASIAPGTTVRTLASITVAADTVNNRVELDFADVTETPVTATTNQFVVFMSTGVDSTSPLIVCGNISSTLTPVSGTLTMTVNAEGFAAVNY
jgi:hypothetical protein